MLSSTTRSTSRRKRYEFHRLGKSLDPEERLADSSSGGRCSADALDMRQDSESLTSSLITDVEVGILSTRRRRGRVCPMKSEKVRVAVEVRNKLFVSTAATSARPNKAKSYLELEYPHGARGSVTDGGRFSDTLMRRVAMWAGFFSVDQLARFSMCHLLPQAGWRSIGVVDRLASALKPIRTRRRYDAAMSRGL